MSGPSEAEIQARIMLALGKENNLRLFRNNVGTGWQGEVVHRDRETILLRRPRAVAFGLCVGSSDLIGWHAREVTESMVGSRIAQFVALEVKSATGTPTREQRHFLKTLHEFGGKGGIARTPAEAAALFGVK